MDSAAIDLQHQFYDMLMLSQYWSADKMRDYQRSQLTHLLRHAKKNVPFYENRLDAVLKPNGDIDWDRWGEIPIVKRSDLLEHREAMQARELPPGHGPKGTATSSGSTGLPITVTVNRLGVLASKSCSWRAHRWHDLDWTKDAFGWRGADPSVAAGPDPRDRGVWGPPWLTNTDYGHAYELNYLVPIDRVVEYMRHSRPSYLTVTPKTAFMLALEFERHGLNCTVDRILTFGARAESIEKEAFLRIFGARELELYSSKEGQHIAHQRHDGAGLYVNSELVLVEIVDEDGMPCFPNQQGRVIITPLYNTAQPLVRYDQGDLARWGTSEESAISLPILSQIDGRVRHMFRHPDGRKISRQIPDSARKDFGALQWQFAQVGPLEFELRYVPANPDLWGDTTSMLATFRKWIFEDANLTFRRLDKLPPNREGKLIEYVSELQE